MVIDHTLASKDDSVTDDAGEPRQDLAEEVLTQAIWDDEQALFDAVTWVNSRDGASMEHTIWVDRAAVSEVLARGGQISGTAAFEAFQKCSETHLTKYP